MRKGLTPSPLGPSPLVAQQLLGEGSHLRAWGPESAPPLLLLHGFTGHGGFWEPTARALGDRFRCLAPDLPGHGRTPAMAMAMPEAADALAAQLPPGPLPVVGYSMGGRLALHLAVRHPERVSAVVAVGASAGLESDQARALRRAADARWARMLREEGLEAFLAAWEAQPLFATQQALLEADRAWLRDLRAEQEPRALAASLEAFGLGAQPPLQAALPSLPMPVWLLAGGEDAKFSAIATDLAGRLPRGRALIVPGTGHNIPLEAPRFFVSFLARTLAPASLERSHP